MKRMSDFKSVGDFESDFNKYIGTPWYVRINSVFSEKSGKVGLILENSGRNTSGFWPPYVGKLRERFLCAIRGRYNFIGIVKMGGRVIANPDKITMGQLKEELRGFSGTENYYKQQLFPMFRFTDGVKYLAEKAQAYWLIDLIFSHQHKAKVRNAPFQIWILTVTGHGTGMIECREDTGLPIISFQAIPYTDFPQGEIKLYFINNVLLLPNEY